jgi:hypothetical protein
MFSDSYITNLQLQSQVFDYPEDQEEEDEEDSDSA